MHNNCTITTDISLDEKLQVATYAFWISTNHGYFTMTGILKAKTNSTTHAETAAIGNALSFVIQKFGEGYFDNVRVNTDSKGAKHAIDIRKKGIGESVHALCSRAGKDFRIVHVKGHTSKKQPRYYVNNWCDKQARKALNEARTKLNYNLNYQLP